MPELPVLPPAVERKLSISLTQLLEDRSLARGRFALIDSDYISKFDQKLVEVATKTYFRESYAIALKKRLHNIPLPVCIAAAQARFYQLTEEYWPIWYGASRPHEEYGASLTEINRRVLREIGSVWVGRSPQLDQWWEQYCRPAVENILKTVARSRFEQARSVEIERLSKADRGNPLSAEIKGGGDLSPAAKEALRRAAVTIQNSSDPATDERPTEVNPDIPDAEDDHQGAIQTDAALTPQTESVIGPDIDFSTRDSRKDASAQTRKILKINKAIAAASGVSYQDFNAWENHGHKRLAKGGYSEKAQRIENLIRHTLSAPQKT